MDRLDSMRAFIVVAETRNFAAAARQLGLSAPAVTRAVAGLEERIGIRLLHRTTRMVRLTDAGATYLTDCKRILAELDEAEASAAGTHGQPRGALSLTASVMFGRIHVAPVMLKFLDAYPEVTVRTLFVDRVVDIIDEGFDVAVRIAHLPDSSLSAVRVGSVRRVICASPDYLVRHGVPQSPADLEHHHALQFSGVLAAEPWVFRDGSVTPPARLIVNASDVAIAAALAGKGVTRVLSYMIAPHLQDGRLKIILADHELPPVPVHLVHREGRRANARVRSFIDFAASHLQASLASLPA
jgi:DNA-binding transcriptional LysR family regulator